MRTTIVRSRTAAKRGIPVSQKGFQISQETASSGRAAALLAQDFMLCMTTRHKISAPGFGCCKRIISSHNITATWQLGNLWRCITLSCSFSPGHLLIHPCFPAQASSVARLSLSHFQSPVEADQGPSDRFCVKMHTIRGLHDHIRCITCDQGPAPKLQILHQLPLVPTAYETLKYEVIITLGTDFTKSSQLKEVNFTSVMQNSRLHSHSFSLCYLLAYCSEHLAACLACASFQRLHSRLCCATVLSASLNCSQRA